MKEFPEIFHQVKDGSLQPGVIEIEAEMIPIFSISYERITQEFDRLGAERVASKAS
ncbi:hypothetical protein BMS3Abin01_00445 [bacterium BMS3Abin01]|nr:hypothetical protein BMS3Abin01_00445 [bacterium BMS3Abin01]